MVASEFFFHLIHLALFRVFFALLAGRISLIRRSERSFYCDKPSAHSNNAKAAGACVLLVCWCFLLQLRLITFLLLRDVTFVHIFLD